MKAIICTLIILLTFSCGNILNNAESTDTAENDPATDNEIPPGNETGEDTEAPFFSGIKNAEALNNTEIQLGWNPATDNRTDSSDIVYDIYISTNQGSYDFTTADYTTSEGAESCIISELVSKTTYYFVVRARDEAGNQDDNTEEISGETVVPLDIVFVLDTSGSMEAGDLQYQKDICSYILDNRYSCDRVCFFYSSNGEAFSLMNNPIHHMPDFVSLDNNSAPYNDGVNFTDYKSYCLYNISQIVGEGTSATWDAVRDGIDKAYEYSNDNQYSVVITFCDSDDAASSNNSYGGEGSHWFPDGDERTEGQIEDDPPRTYISYSAGTGPYPDDFPFLYNVADPGPNGINNSPVPVFCVGIDANFTLTKKLEEISNTSNQGKYYSNPDNEDLDELLSLLP